jgi:hypothetical protein
MFLRQKRKCSALTVRLVFALWVLGLPRLDVFDVWGHVQSGQEVTGGELTVANVYGGDQALEKKEIRARRLKCVDGSDVLWHHKEWTGKLSGFQRLMKKVW